MTPVMLTVVMTMTMAKREVEANHWTWAKHDRRRVNDRRRTVNHRRWLVDDGGLVHNDGLRVNNGGLLYYHLLHWRRLNCLDDDGGGLMHHDARGLLHQDGRGLIHDGRRRLDVNRRRFVDWRWLERLGQQQARSHPCHHFPRGGPFFVAGLDSRDRTSENSQHCCDH
jgi:hypothetical protein